MMLDFVLVSLVSFVPLSEMQRQQRQKREQRQQRQQRGRSQQRRERRRDAETTERSADNRENRDNRDAETTERKNNKKYDARLRSSLSRPSRPSVRHCESRKARGNLILSALPRRFPRSLKLPRNDAQFTLCPLCFCVN